MSRPLALALIAISLASCKSTPPSVDPIYGRQRIPPQRTGTMGQIVPRDGSPPPAGYYNEPASGGASSLPAAPGAGGDLAPPGGFGFQGSSSRTVVPDTPT